MKELPYNEEKQNYAEAYNNISVWLVDFLLSRGLIRLTDDIDSSGNISPRKVGKGKYAVYKPKFIECLFDLTLPPLKWNLPMVVPPLDWQIKPGVSLKRGEVPSIFDLKGGYLSHAQQRFMYRYRLLTSKEYANYYTEFSSYSGFLEFQSVINKLQRQPLQINSDMLELIKLYRKQFEEAGLLMPSFLANVVPHKVYELLRQELVSDADNIPK